MPRALFPLLLLALIVATCGSLRIGNDSPGGIMPATQQAGGVISLPGPTPSPTPSSPASTSPAVSSAPTGSTVDGLPILTVSQLLDQRAADTLHGGPIALRGYWTSRITPRTCPSSAPNPGELELCCVDGEFGITDRPEAILQIVHYYYTVPAPGPHLTPLVPDELDQTLLASSAAEVPPVPIVVVGHLDDPRAADCRPASQQACQDRFVIDRLVSFDPSLAIHPTPTPRPTPFPDPPPSPMFTAAQCHGDIPYSFVGWTATARLHAGVDFPGHVYAIVTRDVILLSPWVRDPQGSGHKYRLWGRTACISEEYMPEGIAFGIIEGTAYGEWDDGHRTAGQ